MVESYDPDDEKDFLDCVGECTYVKRREERTRDDGTTVVEIVERCTGCGRVYGRSAVDADPPPDGEVSPR